MSNEIEILEDTPEALPAAAPAPQPDAKKDGSAFDAIDYDRLAGGDEEYAKEVNASLADAPIPDDSQVADPAVAKEPAAEQAPAPKQGEDFFAFEDGDPVYKGAPFKVTKAELKALVQQGKHLSQEMEKIAPLRRMAKESPEFAKLLEVLAKDPEKAAQFKEQLRQAAAPKEAEDDLGDLQIEGLHPDDVKNVAKIQKALRERESKKITEQSVKEQREQDAKTQEKDLAARAFVSALRTSEGETFDKVRPHMKALMDQAEMEADPEAFKNFKKMVTDPFVVDKAGRPIFHRFYEEAKARMIKMEGGGNSPAAAAPSNIVPFKQPPQNQARMQPGSADASAASSSREPNWAAMSQAEFDKRMNEALQRAN
jgi:hypothetical protein